MTKATAEAAQKKLIYLVTQALITLIKPVEPRFAWMKTSGILLSPFLKSRTGVTYKKEWSWPDKEFSEIFAELYTHWGSLLTAQIQASLTQQAEPWEETIKESPETASHKNFVATINEDVAHFVEQHMNNNDSAFACLTGLFPTAKAKGRPAGVPGPRQTVTLYDLTIGCTRNYSQYKSCRVDYTGSLELDKEDVLGFLREDDLSGLQEHIQNELEDLYRSGDLDENESDWEDGEIDPDSISDEQADGPDYESLAEGLQEALQNELQEESEEA